MPHAQPTELSASDLNTALRAATADGVDADVAAIVETIAAGCVSLADHVGRGGLGSVAGVGPHDDDHHHAVVGGGGDVQHPLDVVAHDLFVGALRSTPVQSVLSEEAQEPIPVDPSASFAVAIDPLDGSHNAAVNAPIGTIFSVLSCTPHGEPDSAFLQCGDAIRAAGFVMYGPATVMALSLGDGTDLFVLDRWRGRFVLLRSDVTIPTATREFAINASNRRHWDPRLRDYVDDLVAGAEGPRGADFNMRWIAAVVAEAYRILLRGGIFLYPSDARDGYRTGRLRLVYEAQPIAFIIEQAGGAASDTTGPILERRPVSLHERTPLVFGSPDKVQRLAGDVASAPFTGERAPLFAQRGLFRT